MDSDDGWLQLDWWTDGDGSGRLNVAVSVAGWGGCSEVWFNRDQVLTLAEDLRRFPFPEAGVALGSGYGAPGSSEYCETVHLRVFPIGDRGQLGIEVRLRPWFERPSEVQPDTFLSLLVPCTYPGLQQFANDMESMVGPEVLDPAVGHFAGTARIEVDRLL